MTVSQLIVQLQAAEKNGYGRYRLEVCLEVLQACKPRVQSDAALLLGWKQAEVGRCTLYMLPSEALWYREPKQ